MKKKKIILAATSALAVLALAACSGSTNKDIATMKGGTITVEDFYNEAKHTQNNQQLVQNMIIYKAFENKYGDKVTDKDVNAEYKKNEETYGDTFKSQLEAAGYTEDSYKQALRSSLVLKAGISANVKVTEKDLKEAKERELKIYKDVKYNELLEAQRAVKLEQYNNSILKQEREIQKCDLYERRIK